MRHKLRTKNSYFLSPSEQRLAAIVLFKTERKEKGVLQTGWKRAAEVILEHEEELDRAGLAEGDQVNEPERVSMLVRQNDDQASGQEGQHKRGWAHQDSHLEELGLHSLKEPRTAQLTI